ncbi:MAG: hypothetical protein SWK76_12735 [Actinomycetota bacterium]|nr:hypothetical protein [Actinomycetota bacterium]
MEELAWKVGDSQFLFFLENPEPIVPPVIKKVTGNPPRLSSLRLDLQEGYPCFCFHPSEISMVKWHVIDPSSDIMYILFSDYFTKGDNTLVITDADLENIRIRIGYEGDLESLKKLVFESYANVIEVVDMMTGVSKSYPLE